jgi:hypothetical protein
LRKFECKKRNTKKEAEDNYQKKKTNNQTSEGEKLTKRQNEKKVCQWEKELKK